MKYPFIKYVNDLPSGFSGMAKGPFVKILKSSRGDRGLVAHEMVHVKQWFKMPIVHDILYKYNKKYRLKCEVAAYRIQLGLSKNKVGDKYLFASYIAKYYDLYINEDEAYDLL